MIKRNALVEQARTWEHVPYKDKGRDRFGIDCIGVLLLSAQDAGLSDYETLDYPRRPVPQDFLRGMRNKLGRIQKAEAGHGDILVFREPRHPCHVGILDMDPNSTLYVIHAYAPARKVLREPMTAERWSRAVMAFRIPGDN
jgi:cell wall-associated NlpC family hydrolase